MRLWLIVRTDDVNYDEARSAVVAALTSRAAREVMVMDASGDQSGDVWFLPTTRIDDIGEANPTYPAGIVIINQKEG